MTPNQINTLQTLVFLLDKQPNLILENDLFPYLKKANELKEVMNN